MKILYVEDDEHVQWITSAILISLEHEVTPASSAAQAWKILEQNAERFDCLILDKNMPQCSGLELMRAIRSSAWHYDVPAIMLTGESGNHSMIECLEGGVNLYLTKPATKELLHAALEQLQTEISKRQGLLDRSNQFAGAVSSLNQGYFRIQTPSQASSLAMLLCQQAQRGDHAYLGLFEILINAIEHGNLQLKPSQRKDLVTKDHFHEHLEAMTKQEPFRKKWVDIHFSTDEQFATISVTDQGTGFDWKTCLTQNLSTRSWGNIRGFHRIMNAGFDSLHYRDEGRTAVIRMKKAVSFRQSDTGDLLDSVAHIDPLEHCATGQPVEPPSTPATPSQLDMKSMTTMPLTNTPAIENDVFDRSNGELLKAIHKIASGFIASNDFGKFFELTLDVILSVTESEYGFLSELMYDEQQRPFMRAYAISNISWDKGSQARYESFKADGYMDFHAMDNLFGSVLMSGEPLISNNPMADPRSSGFPKGHWNMDAFLGIPLMGSGKVLGMVAIANRPGGYHKDMIDWLEPVRSTLSSIIISMRNERHRLTIEKQLKEAKEIAERANDAKSFFLATISHEIRTPMNAIVGMSDLLMESPLTSTQTYFAQVINRNSELLLSIINDVLNLSKLKAGKMKLIEGDFDLEVVLAEVADILGHSAAEKNLELILSYPSNLPHKLYGDAAKIKQILINLINNAIKFTDQGHILVAVKSQTPGTLCIEVQDTGIGIPEDEIPQLFGLFHQVDQTASREHGGTGLGLAISQQFAQLLGGQINIQSKQGKGSTFGFEFPIKVIEADEVKLYPHIRDLKVHVLSSCPEVCRQAQQHLAQYDNIEVCTYGPGAHFELEVCSPQSSKPNSLILIEQRHPLLEHKPNRQNSNQNAFLIYSAQDVQVSTSVKDVFTEDGVLGIAFKHFGFERFDQEVSKAIARLNSKETYRSAENTKSSFGKLNSAPGVDFLSMSETPPSILLVEDNPINQDVASLVLTQMGCLVDVAFNGVQALEKFGRHAYDLIFMDCQMPVMDGLTATAKIRERETEQNKTRTPIVAITANALPSDRMTCINAGMDDYLSKPFKRSQVKDILEKFLAPENKGRNKEAPVTTKPVSSEHHVFDAAMMMEVTNNDWDLITKIVHRYKSSLPAQIAELIRLLNSNDDSVLCAELHRMRGAAVGTGFSIFSNFLKEIETNIRFGRPLQPAATIERLNDHFESIMKFSVPENEQQGQ